MSTTESDEDILDSRDLIIRLEELEEEIGDLQEALDEFENNIENAEEHDDVDALSEQRDQAAEAIKEWHKANNEFTTLKAFVTDMEGYSSDWRYGETLINESYIYQYLEELAKDVGDIPKDMPSYIVIDWEATAENLLEDYTYGYYNGTKYYMRES